MASKEQFLSDIQSGYTFKGDSILLGLGKLNEENVSDALIKAPLKMFNRHGLIAGATGTGKTISLQVIAENLSKSGVPVLLMDIKGDLSGISMTGSTNPKVEERNAILKLENNYTNNPAEFITISNEPGTPMRATVSEFGPVLLGKILGLNDTQEGVLSMLFKYCDDKGLALLDLKDLREVLIRASDELKDELTKQFGSFSTTTSGTILRKVIEIEQQGADKFFGEMSFEVEDLVRIIDGKGVVNIFRLTDIQDKPKLFSSFMLCLLAEIYNSFPEIGDPDKPKLVLFIDEAHLIFEEATPALTKQLETTIKLIRSKGVGIFFITQNPADIPESILGQLGMKVQHALRAFTAKDQKAIKLAAENFPMTDYYDIEKTLTSMGIGEALVTVLNEKGIPTPLAHTLMRPPLSRIGVLTNGELQDIIDNSDIKEKYEKVVDRESAYELLQGKLSASKEEEDDDNEEVKKSIGKKEEEGGGILDTVGDAVNSPVGKIVMREVTRGLLGVLGLKSTTTRRRKSKGLFW
jgi:DNA helicase HerA-like ATPase